MNRDQAWDFLKEHTKKEGLRKHALAVEGAMEIYAKYFGEEEEPWRVCGLLHDVDYEKYPDTHPIEGTKWLREKGCEEVMVTAIMGHADFTNTPRESLMAKTLYAVDELSGFIVAVALVRPNGFEGMKPKSVKKKLKDKGFAKAVSREDIIKGAEALNIELTEHIDRVIQGLKEQDQRLKAQGDSLLFS